LGSTYQSTASPLLILISISLLSLSIAAIIGNNPRRNPSKVLMSSASGFPRKLWFMVRGVFFDIITNGSVDSDSTLNAALERSADR
jgi:hypothetical protein